MIVPVFSVNCGALCFFSPFSRQCQRLYFAKNSTSLLPQRGHSTPSGQRRATKYSRQLSGLAKYATASKRVFGSVAMVQLCGKGAILSSIFVPLLFGIDGSVEPLAPK